jgi:tRNA pseudouridine38-40 synthase
VSQSNNAACQRVALGIEYNGSAFHGWQLQRDPVMPTVQAALERALAKIANHPLRVHCAGRTDTGVHAMAQVVHFDTTAIRPLKAWIMGVNAELPADICVRWAQHVPQHFHARFSAFRRRYRYIIYNEAVRSAVLAGKVTWQCLPLDVELMHQEAQQLLGTHDFSSYRAVACQSRSPVRDVYGIELRRQGPLVVMDIEANAFLMHMIRNIAGVLMAVGSGRQAPGWTRQVLQARDRKSGGVTARPHGLYFMGALYPESYGLPGYATAPEFAVF